MSEQLQIYVRLKIIKKKKKEKSLQLKARLFLWIKLNNGLLGHYTLDVASVKSVKSVQSKWFGFLASAPLRGFET